MAAFWGELGVAHLLIALGADVNAKSDDGKTPLRYAVDEGHLHMVGDLTTLD